MYHSSLLGRLNQLYTIVCAYGPSAKIICRLIAVASTSCIDHIQNDRSKLAKSDSQIMRNRSSSVPCGYVKIAIENGHLLAVNLYWLVVATHLNNIGQVTSISMA